MTSKTPSTPPYHLDVTKLSSKSDTRDEKLVTDLDPRFYDPNYDPLPEIIDSLDIQLDFNLTSAERAQLQLSRMGALDIDALVLPPPPSALENLDEEKQAHISDINGSLRQSYDHLEQTLAHFERSHGAVSRVLDAEMHVNKHRFIEGLLNASELHRHITNALYTSRNSRAHLAYIFDNQIRTSFYIAAKARAQQRLSIVHDTLTRIQKQIEIRTLANSQYQRRNLASYIEVLLHDQQHDNEIANKLKCIQQWSPSALLERCTLIIDGYFADVIKSILSSVDNSRVFSPDLIMMVSFLRAPVLIASYGEVFTHPKSNPKSQPSGNPRAPTQAQQNAKVRNIVSQQPMFTSESMNQLITKQFFELEDSFLTQIRILLAQCSQQRALQPKEYLPSSPGAPSTAFLCKGIGPAHFLRLIKTITTSYIQLEWFLFSCLSCIDYTHAYCLSLIMKLHFQRLGEEDHQSSTTNTNSSSTTGSGKPQEKDELLNEEIVTAIAAQFTNKDIEGLLQPESFYANLSDENKKVFFQTALDGRTFPSGFHGLPKYQPQVYSNLLTSMGKDALHGISDLKAIIYSLAKNIAKQCTSVVVDLYTSSINLSLSDIRAVTPIIFVLTTTVTVLLQRMNKILYAEHSSASNATSVQKTPTKSPSTITPVPPNSPQSQPPNYLNIDQSISLHTTFQPLLHSFFLTTLTKFKLYQTRIFSNIRELLQGDAFIELEVGDLVDKIPDLRSLLQLQFEYDYLGRVMTGGDQVSVIPNKHPFAIDCDSTFTFLYSYFLSTVNLAANKEYRIAVTMLYNNSQKPISQNATGLNSSQSFLGPNSFPSSQSSLSSLQQRLTSSITISSNQRKQLNHYINYLEECLWHRDPEILLYNHPEYLQNITQITPFSEPISNPTSPPTTPKSSGAAAAKTPVPWQSLSEKAITAFRSIPEAHQMFRFLYDSQTFTPTIPPVQNFLITAPTVAPGLPPFQQRQKDSCAHSPTLTSSSISLFKTTCSLLLSAVSFSPFQDFFFQVLADSIELYTYCIASSILSSFSVTVNRSHPNSTAKNPQTITATTSALTYIASGSVPSTENDGYDGWDSDDEYPCISDHRVVETALLASTTRVAPKLANTTSPPISSTVLATADQPSELTTTTQHSKDRLMKSVLPFHTLQSINASGLNIAGPVIAELYPQKHMTFPPSLTSPFALQPWIQYPRLHRLIRTFVNHVDNSRFGNVFNDFSTSRRLAIQQMALANVSNVGFGLGSVSHHSSLHSAPSSLPVAPPVNKDNDINTTINNDGGSDKPKEKESLSSRWGLWTKKWGGDGKKEPTAAPQVAQPAAPVPTPAPSPPAQASQIKSASAPDNKTVILEPPDVCQLSPILDLSNPDELYGIQVKITSSVILMQLSLLLDALAHLSVFSSTNNNTASTFMLSASEMIEEDENAETESSTAPRLENTLQTSQSMVDIIQESNSSRQVILRHLFNSKQLLKKVSVELLMFTLSQSCHDSINSLNIPTLIKSTNYSINQIAVTNSPFVQTIKTHFTTWFNFLSQQKVCSCFLLPISAMLSYGLSEQVLLGMSQIPKISDEGRMLLSQDISVLYDFLSKCTQLRPLPFSGNVTEAATSMYLDGPAFVTWVGKHIAPFRLQQSTALALTGINSQAKSDKSVPTKIERLYEDNDFKLESVKSTLAILRKQKMDTLLTNQRHRNNKSASSQDIPSGSLKALLNSNIDKFAEYILRLDQFQSHFYSTNNTSTALNTLRAAKESQPTEKQKQREVQPVEKQQQQQQQQQQSEALKPVENEVSEPKPQPIITDQSTPESTPIVDAAKPTITESTALINNNQSAAKLVEKAEKPVEKAPAAPVSKPAEAKPVDKAPATTKLVDKSVANVDNTVPVAKPVDKAAAVAKQVKPDQPAPAKPPPQEPISASEDLNVISTSSPLGNSEVFDSLDHFMDDLL